MKPDLTDLERLARQAGGILRLGFAHEHQVEYKGTIDLVTEMDHRSEEYLLGEIQERFPGHQIVSEEIGLVPGEAAQQWYVDPLDGTVNYMNGLPFFAVSVGVLWNRQPAAGAIYARRCSTPLADSRWPLAVGSW